MKKRNLDIDLLKGVSILLVVIGHTIQYSYAPENFDNVFLFRFIYSFHMPLFMFISGYLSYNKQRKMGFSWIVNRFVKLIIPFFSWIVIDYVLKGYSMSLFERIKHVFEYPDNGLWFLLILFYNSLILFFVNVLSKRKKINDLLYIILILIVNFVDFNLYGFGLLKWYVIFYSLGYFANKYILNFLMSHGLIKIIVILSYIIFSITVAFWQRIGNPLFFNYVNIENSFISSVFLILYRYTVPLTAIITVSSVCIYLKKYLTMFVDIGKYTLEIYCIHFYIINIFGYNSNIILLIIIVISSLFVPIIISKAFKDNKTIMKLLFGK